MLVILQAEDRAHRIGQKKDVLVLILVSAGTIEQAILDKAQLKRDLDAKVIQVDHFNLLFVLHQAIPASFGLTSASLEHLRHSLI